MILSWIPCTVPTIAATFFVAGWNASVAALTSLNIELIVALFPTPVFPKTNMVHVKSKSSWLVASCSLAIALALSLLNAKSLSCFWEILSARQVLTYTKPGQ